MAVTERVVLHVGTPKSGTTYLQGILAANAERLAAAGVRVVGAEHIELVHAAMVIREDQRLQSLPDHAAGAWDRLRAEIAGFEGHTAVLSYELLAPATREQADRAIQDLGDYDVEVVVTARDFARAVPSAWQERLKFALTTPFAEWEPPPNTDRRSEWGWRTLDPAGVAARWGRSLAPDRVHLVTAPRSGDPAVLWQRFAEAVGIGDVAVELPTTRRNESLGAGAAEVLRRVNEQVTAPIEGNREHALWLRDTLAHEILAPLDDEPIAVTDDQFAEAEEQFERSSERLATQGYRWHGDVEDLRPQRRPGRAPDDVPADRLLDIAVRALWAMLLQLREAHAGTSAAAAHDAPEAGGRAAAARRLVTAPARRRVDQQQRELERRLRQLDESLAQSRRMQYRLAMVTDVVGELLLPFAEQDEAVLSDFVHRYRPEAL